LDPIYEYDNITGGGGGTHSGGSNQPVGVGRSFFVNVVLEFGAGE